MSSRCCGTCAGLRRAGQSERKQARKALVLLERSSLARPNHSRRRLGQVHSRKHKAGTSSGVRADLALPLLHSLTITGGTMTQRCKTGVLKSQTNLTSGADTEENHLLFASLDPRTNLLVGSSCGAQASLSGGVFQPERRGRRRHTVWQHGIAERQEAAQSYTRPLYTQAFSFLPEGHSG